MTDRIKLTQDELDYVAGQMSASHFDHPSALKRALRRVNDRRAEREAEIRSVTASVHSEVPRGVVSDELRAKIEYAQTFTQRDDKLRTEALRLAVSLSGRPTCFSADETADIADVFFKFLKGSPS